MHDSLIARDSGVFTSVPPLGREADMAGNSRAWSGDDAASDGSAQPVSSVIAAQDQSNAPDSAAMLEAVPPARSALSVAPEDPRSDLDIGPLLRELPAGDAQSKQPIDRAASAGPLGDAPSLLAGNPATATVSIKDPSSSAAPSSSSPNLADQLSYHLIRSVENGNREVVLQVHPPELGNLTVRVLLNGRDVMAWFGSPQPQVQQAISQAIGQLHTDLGKAGYNLNSAWVGGDASSAREQGGNPPQQRGAPNRQRLEEQPSFPALSAAPGVSIYV